MESQEAQHGHQSNDDDAVTFESLLEVALGRRLIILILFFVVEFIVLVEVFIFVVCHSRMVDVILFLAHKYSAFLGNHSVVNRILGFVVFAQGCKESVFGLREGGIAL